MRWIVPTVLCLCLVACRGEFSEKPPIHVVPNMDDQERFDAQEANPNFADGRSNRPQVPGTVARKSLRLDPVLYEGRTPDNLYVLDNPLPITEELLRRGRERYDIHCAVCHDGAGTGRGMVVRYPQSRNVIGFVPLPSYHEERIREQPDGMLFETITHGVRTMPAYAAQISPRDRWAIIAYVRALQRSQNAERTDVPRDQLESLDRP
jgi:mono/diheme cytochrome c family protein